MSNLGNLLSKGFRTQRSVTCLQCGIWYLVTVLWCWLILQMSGISVNRVANIVCQILLRIVVVVFGWFGFCCRMSGIHWKKKQVHRQCCGFNSLVCLRLVGLCRRWNPCLAILNVFAIAKYRSNALSLEKVNVSYDLKW